MAYPEDCDLVYDSTEAELRFFYNERAEHYDSFLEDTQYVLHDAVVNEVLQRFQDPSGKVIDIACGTGKVGSSLLLARRSMLIHGVDISDSMLSIASQKHCYSVLFNLNIKTEIADITDTYDLLISAGAFTPGHLVADDLINITSLLHSGGLAVVSVKKDHFENDNFKNKIDQAIADEVIQNYAESEVRIWEHPDYTDTAIIVSFVKK